MCVCVSVSGSVSVIWTVTLIYRQNLCFSTGEYVVEVMLVVIKCCVLYWLYFVHNSLIRFANWIGDIHYYCIIVLVLWRTLRFDDALSGIVLISLHAFYLWFIWIWYWIFVMLRVFGCSRIRGAFRVPNPTVVVCEWVFHLCVCVFVNSHSRVWRVLCTSLRAYINMYIGPWILFY